MCTSFIMLDLTCREKMPQMQRTITTRISMDCTVRVIVLTQTQRMRYRSNQIMHVYTSQHEEHFSVRKDNSVLSIGVSKEGQIFVLLL